MDIEARFDKINNIYNKLTNESLTDYSLYTESLITLLPDKFYSILIKLGIAGIKNQNDWSDGYNYISSIFNKYGEQIKQQDEVLYDEYINLLDDTEHIDGRQLKNLDNNPRALLNKGLTLFEFDKDIPDSKRVLLKKLFTYSNIKFLINKEQCEIW